MQGEFKEEEVNFRCSVSTLIYLRIAGLSICFLGRDLAYITVILQALRISLFSSDRFV